MRVAKIVTLLSTSLPLCSVWAGDAPVRVPLSWTEAAVKATHFVSQLNTTEKIDLVTGSYGSSPALPCVGMLVAIERLNYTGLCLSDGPAGLSRSDGVSVFASGITVAATWDRRLMYERGLAIGQEFRAKGLDMETPGTTSPTGIFYFGDSLADTIEAGNISPARLDDMATRVMTPYFRLGQDEDFPVTDPAS
ncbi:hypothetical protein GT037_005443 [Alternaria burnsii]|uniref:beta-glucosidase n=1 Tax=Alternaria burnsii TaxID=1187904 RepID=A0A8H7B6G4_9PLEO|nr:uncharacterized protein GT037_005443 [Alternaria burnsii]KAF7677231.1 hypothetical protein GT037_005443 [Alternaria burnsii]